MLDIIHIAKEAPGTILAVRADDLVAANESLIGKIRADIEREIEARRSAKLLTKETVIELLSVSSTTLWRWEKSGYLVPVNVGGQRRYRSTDVNEIMEGQK